MSHLDEVLGLKLSIEKASKEVCLSSLKLHWALECQSHLKQIKKILISTFIVSNLNSMYATFSDKVRLG